ncbi:hypothetical protein PR048_013956 [Dryococelus australis]|uniref:PiggyBac transposable element-derived protein domain-containing protein n=1 Tax=Dryococelus australis TaxID=614101 RepID=A0ABQ9HV98_9NEOP|nr:hypothetical protein PR048_013956 [Dryococelus australis]
MEKRKIVTKLKMIVDYNHSKTYIDTSDQILCRTVKWQHKIAVEMISGFAPLNAIFVYNSFRQKNNSVTDFKEEKEYKNTPTASTPPSLTVSKCRSFQSQGIDKRPGKFNKVRKYCKGCSNHNDIDSEISIDSPMFGQAS